MDKWEYSYLIELKTLWKLEKLLITSNFSFFHNVFKSCLLLMHQNEYLWSKGLRSPLVAMLFQCLKFFVHYCNRSESTERFDKKKKGQKNEDDGIMPFANSTRNIGNFLVARSCSFSHNILQNCQGQRWGKFYLYIYMLI